MKSAHSARPLCLSHQGLETIDEGRQQPAINPRGEWEAKIPSMANIDNDNGEQITGNC